MASSRITKVAIYGLFGLYDHEISLNQQSRITIIHGPNGVGKTALLRCLTAFLRGRYHLLGSTPFNVFHVEWDDGSNIVIERGRPPKGADAAGALPSLTAQLNVRGAPHEVHDLTALADVTELAKAIEMESPFLYPVNKNRYVDHRSSRHYTAEEVVERFGGRLHGREARWPGLSKSEPSLLRDLRTRVSVRFIETNRLYKVDPELGPQADNAALENTVDDYAKELHDRIEATLAQYGRQAQQLDQSFPHRLIREDVSEFTRLELKQRLEALERRQQTLSEIGLLDRAESPALDMVTLDAIPESKKVTMTLYILDNEQKISVLDELAARIRLLLDSVNRKFRNKRLVISREAGLVAVSANGSPLALSALSSGEQHEIVLLYELLFNTRAGTLVLIDEPELSLHVTWQKMFMPELLSVASQVGFDAVVATHSPFIVGDRLDLTIPLEAEMDRDPAERTQPWFPEASDHPTTRFRF